MVEFSGALTALVTPFRGGKVDETALRELVEEQIRAGIHGLVPCGTTGESVALGESEHRLVVRTVVAQAKGRVPVLAGAGAASTAHTIELCRIAREERADGVLLVCPYYNRPTQAGLEAHFRAVLAEVPIPAVLYNIPGRTGIDLQADTLERLANVASIVGVKEATGNVLRAQEIAQRSGDRFVVLSGDDVLTVAMMAVGARGVISVTSNIAPREVVRVVELVRKGSFREAFEEHRKLLSLHQSLFLESNPGPAKGALAHMGRIAPEIRLPLVWPSASTVQAVTVALGRAGVRP